MTRAVVLCVRFSEPPGEEGGHLDLVNRVEQDAAQAAGRVIGFGAERFTLAFPEEQRGQALPLASALALELRDSAVGIALGDVLVDQETGRAFGAGLVLGETLANAARPGEVLVHPDLDASSGFTTNGTANVRYGGTTIRAASCTASTLPVLEDSRPTHPLLEPIADLPPIPSVPDALATRSSVPPELPHSEARISLRPASPSAPPFRRSGRPPSGEPGQRMTPPPKPSTLPPADRSPMDAPRRSVPPKKPQGQQSGRATPVPEEPDPVPRAPQLAERGTRVSAGSTLPRSARGMLDLLAGLEALSRARSRGDRQDELACTALLGQLARAAGHFQVADLWSARSRTADA